MKFAVIIFPGSNCDKDCTDVLSRILKQEVVEVFHSEENLPSGTDCIILPGGFSYGDYLRCGAIARFSKIMDPLIHFASQGKPVIGICNGFQILTEAGLLPGSLLRNQSLNFICKDVFLRTEASASIFSKHLPAGKVLRIPIAHGEGNYFADAKTLQQMKTSGQIVLHYCDEAGQLTPDANPNGSLENIAGVCNEAGNVLGLMPHPERCAEAVLGNRDGLQLFAGLMQQTIFA